MLPSPMKQVMLFCCFLFALSAYSQKAVKVNVERPGSLQELLTETQQDTCSFLIVSGKLNSADIKVLRRMAGADGRGRLCGLNLLDARIVSSKEPYLIIRRAEKSVVPRVSTEFVMPLSAFSGGGPTMEEIEHAYSGGSLAKEISHVNFILPNKISQPAEERFISENMSQWKKLRRQKLNAKGHRFSRDKDGHYTYSAFSHKDMFCEDMFYQCPNLQYVILPHKGKIYDRIVIDGDPIRYKEEKSAKTKE